MENKNDVYQNKKSIPHEYTKIKMVYKGICRGRSTTIKIHENLKKHLDTLKLFPDESYENLLIRLLGLQEQIKNNFFNDNILNKFDNITY